MLSLQKIIQKINKVTHRDKKLDLRMVQKLVLMTYCTLANPTKTILTDHLAFM